MIEADYCAEIIVNIDNNVDVKVQYDSTVNIDNVSVQSSSATITNKENVFTCYRNKSGYDESKKDVIIITCNPNTINKINIVKANKLALLIDNNSTEKVRSKRQTSYQNIKTNNAENIIKNTSDIELKVNDTSEIDIIDAVGVNMIIDNTTKDGISRVIDMSYKLLNKLTNTRLFIGNFNNKNTHYINFKLHNPNNVVVFSNNSKVNLNWDKNIESNFSYIQTIGNQITCNNSTNNEYINDIINDVKSIISPIINHLINKGKVDKLKQLSEFIIAHILQNITLHIDTIKENTNNFTNIVKLLHLNKVHKTVLAVFEFIEQKEYKFLVPKDLIESTRNCALDLIKNKKHDSNNIKDINLYNKTREIMKNYFKNDNLIQQAYNILPF